MKAILEELRLSKKKAQGLRYALEDSVAEAKAEEEKANKWCYLHELWSQLMCNLSI